VRVEASLLREAGERTLPVELQSRVPRSRGRPRTEYRPRVRSEDDVATLRRHRVPAMLITPGWVSRHGYPVDFRPWLAVPEELSGKFSSDFRILPVKDGDALRDPGIAEMVTLLLRFDPLAARLVAVRNRPAVDPNELYRRVRNEGVESAATRVRLQDFAPAIPKVGTPLARSELRWIEKNNPPLGDAP
jgi:hypothetical protein